MDQPSPVLGPSPRWPDLATFPEQRPETDTFSQSAVFGEPPASLLGLTSTNFLSVLRTFESRTVRGAAGRGCRQGGAPLGGAADHAKTAAEGLGAPVLLELRGQIFRAWYEEKGLD